jgi:RNA polymerase sigma-70 factor (ECF subfamily)
VTDPRRPDTKRTESTATEASLVGAIRDDARGPAGRAAAAELFRRHQEALYLWCHRLTGDHDRALDLAQDVLLAACRSVAGFEGRSSFKSWLFAIARFRFARSLRSKRLPGAPLDSVPDAEDDAPGPEEDYLVREEEERVIALLKGNLEPHEQDAIWLRCFEGVPVDEITRLLGLDGRSGARGVLQTARRKLRAALGARAAGEGS